MLPIDPSPRKQKVVRTQRVLAWVKDSTNGLLPQVAEIKPPRRNTTKRKIWQDENWDLDSAEKKCQRTETLSSKPLSPRKFYLPNGDAEVVTNRAVVDPSTPKSKQSLATSSSVCFSPDKLDGILIRRRVVNNMSNTSLQSESEYSESLPPTPIKQNITPTPKVHRLSCGLDSPATPTETDGSTGDVVSTEKRFSKLGHRLNGKTPLQLFMESIKNSTRKMGKGKKVQMKSSARPAQSVQSPDPYNEGENTDVEESVSVSHTPNTTASSQQQGHTPTITATPSGRDSDSRDRVDTTLVDDSPTLVQKKLLPLFRRNLTASKDADKKEQLVIDAGQKGLDDARQCVVCRMIYTRGDPNDETLHKQFHSSLIQALKFQGWKKEHIAESGESHRILYIEHSDPPHCRKKVQALKVILDQELGYVQESDMLKPERRVYIYVSNDQQIIKGVCIAESIREASRLEGDRASVACVRASIGINRLWVYAKYRREGVASKLLDSIRSTFEMGMCVPRALIAFSDPTSHGKMFAARYTGTNRFLVYKP